MQTINKFRLYITIYSDALLPGGAADTGLMHEALRDSFRERGLLPPDIMNDAILFLASPIAEGITGERIIATEFRQWLLDKGYTLNL